MSSTPDTDSPDPTDPTDPPKPAAKPWRRWLPLAIVLAVIGAVVIIAVASGGDDDGATSGTASTVDGTVGQSVATDQSAATIDTSIQQTTTDATTPGSSSTTVSNTGSSTSTGSAATDPAGSVPVTTASTGSTTAPTPPPTPSQIDLGSAESFGVLGNTAVGSAGPTVVTGQIGASNGQVRGFSAAGNPAGMIIVDSQTASQAQAAVDGAISQLDGLPSTPLPGDKLDSQTIGPGVYSSANLDVIGAVTLDGGGDPNALFVFESAGTLTFADASQVVLAGGAQACNVYWPVAGSATLGSGAKLVGTVIADDAIAAATGTDVVGRLIARNGAVMLDTASIAASTCA